MRPETFSRALARLKAEGVIPRDGRLMVENVSGLRRFAELTGNDALDGGCD